MSKLNKLLQTSFKESCNIPNFCSEDFLLTQNLSAYAYTHRIACGLPAAEEEEDHVLQGGPGGLTAGLGWVDLDLDIPPSCLGSR